MKSATTLLAALAGLLLAPAVAPAQTEMRNAGDCTILVQGNNNTVTVSSPCTPSRNFVPPPSSGGKAPELRFSIRGFAYDARTHAIFVDITAANGAAVPALVQLVTGISSIQLSDPPDEVTIVRVDGVHACRVVLQNLPERACLKQASDEDSTTIPAGGTLGFRMIGRVAGRPVVTASTSGALTLAVLRKMSGGYARLDLSFLAIKVSTGS